MLIYSVAGIAVSIAAFMYLSRDDKKALVGVGKEADNKLKGSKHKVENGLTIADKADYQAVYNAIAEKLDKVCI